MQEIDYKISKTNLYEVIADKLEAMILSDASQLGQKLPSEQALATSFGVSRNVVRESLKLLKERQLITLRTGEGTYIAKPKSQNLTNVLNRMILMDNIDYSYVFEMRSLLEPYACRMAAQNGDMAGFDALSEITDLMEKNGGNTIERIQYELQFHIRVAELSGNPLLACFVQSMASLLFPLIRKALRPPEGHRSGVEYHRRIIEILKSRDGDLAEETMREHVRLSSMNYYLSEQYEAEYQNPAAVGEQTAPEENPPRLDNIP